MLISNASYHQVSPLVTSADFYEPLHGRLFEAIGDLIAKNSAATPLTLMPQRICMIYRERSYSKRVRATYLSSRIKDQPAMDSRGHEGSVGFRLFSDSPEGAPGRIVVLYAILAAANIAAWAWALIAFRDYPLQLGTAFLAYTFGLRHALDADHIAAIDNVTRKLMQEGKPPAAAGFFFSLGHSTVVAGDHRHRSRSGGVQGQD